MMSPGKTWYALLENVIAARTGAIEIANDMRNWALNCFILFGTCFRQPFDKSLAGWPGLTEACLTIRNPRTSRNAEEPNGSPGDLTIGFDCKYLRQHREEGKSCSRA